MKLAGKPTVFGELKQNIGYYVVEVTPGHR